MLIINIFIFTCYRDTSELVVDYTQFDCTESVETPAFSAKQIDLLKDSENELELCDTDNNKSKKCLLSAWNVCDIYGFIESCCIKPYISIILELWASINNEILLLLGNIIEFCIYFVRWLPTSFACFTLLI